MIYWAKTGPFWHKIKKGGGVPVYCYTPVESFAATEGLPPLQDIYTGIRGARIIKKQKKFYPPPFNFPKTGGGVPF